MLKRLFISMNIYTPLSLYGIKSIPCLFLQKCTLTLSDNKQNMPPNLQN